MPGDEELRNLVQSIIDLHDTQDFAQLSSLVSKSEIEAGTWFTKERFYEVCSVIENEIGRNTSLAYIGSLNRKSSTLTLWRTTYTRSDDEILWQIIFDNESHKIKLMHVNW
ncbi:MAG: hypothetical protein QNL62_19380 [Gammaproteobacteria bacterium]|nr:hypothetical protein [Gammaproteobacteria bacterium]